MLIELYSSLLRLYPRSYRDEFGEELGAVSLAARDAANQGALAPLWLVWREIRDLPGAVVREHLAKRRRSAMGDMLSQNSRGSWKEALAGMTPFLIVGTVPTVLGMVLRWVRPTGPAAGWVGWMAGIGILFPLLIGFGVGWARRFPRWSYPYVGVVVT